MPQYFARGIDVYLQRYSVARDESHPTTKKGRCERPAKCEISETPVEHDGYNTRFIGPLADMPFFLATVEREKMEVSSPIQALELVVDLANSASIPKSCRTFDGSRDLKIEVFLNGDLVACRYRGALIPLSSKPTEVFSGRRVGKTVERPWVLHMEPKAQSDYLTQHVLQRQWNNTSRTLGDQARSRGTNVKGNIPFTAEYLDSLSNLSMNDVFSSSCFNHSRDSTRVKPSIIDVVISYGEGQKMEQMYRSEPSAMKDSEFQTTNNYLRRTRFATVTSILAGNDRTIVHTEQNHTATGAVRSTTPPNWSTNHSFVRRSPFKPTFHVVGNLNEGTATISPERMKHLRRAVAKHSQEEPLPHNSITRDRAGTDGTTTTPTEQTVSDMTRSLVMTSAAQHIETVRNDQEAMTGTPVTPSKRRQCVAELSDETPRSKKSRIDESTEVSHLTTFEAQKSLEIYSSATKTIVSRDEPKPTYSTRASALSRSGLKLKPKLQKNTRLTSGEVLHGRDALMEDLDLKHTKPGSSRSDQSRVANAVHLNKQDQFEFVAHDSHVESSIPQRRQVAQKTPRRSSVNLPALPHPEATSPFDKTSGRVHNKIPVRPDTALQSLPSQQQLTSILKKEDDLSWPPQSSRNCAVTYLDAILCGLGQEEYEQALVDNSLPHLCKVIPRERQGYFKEKGIVCGIRYVIF